MLKELSWPIVYVNNNIDIQIGPIVYLFKYHVVLRANSIHFLHDQFDDFCFLSIYLGLTIMWP